MRRCVQTFGLYCTVGFTSCGETAGCGDLEREREREREDTTGKMGWPLYWRGLSSTIGFNDARESDQH